MLLGEYAALEGGPVLVAAVERYVRCTLTPGVGPLAFEIVGAGEPPDLRFVQAVLAALGEAPTGRCRLDSSALSEATDAGRRKLGLGSSAATCVALTAALRPGADHETICALAQEAHRTAQGGRGSGFDVAASTYGGLLEYVRGSDASRVRRLAVPGWLRLMTVWTGSPASTTELVGRVLAAKAGDPGRHASSMEELAAAARAGVNAVEAADRSALGEAVRGGLDALHRLAIDSGAPIFTPVHTQLAALAAPFGALVKPTGAGGGDLAWLWAPDPGAEAALAVAVEAAGFPVRWLGIDPDGVCEV